MQVRLSSSGVVLERALRSLSPVFYGRALVVGDRSDTGVCGFVAGRADGFRQCVFMSEQVAQESGRAHRCQRQSPNGGRSCRGRGRLSRVQWVAPGSAVVKIGFAQREGASAKWLQREHVQVSFAW